MNLWVDITKQLPGILGQRIHAVQVDVSLLTAKLISQGFRVYRIDGSQIKDERTFFSEVALVFEFPNYFDSSWPSWDDCLGDFGSLAPSRVAIVWENTERTFAADAQTFLRAVCDLNNLAIYAALNPTQQLEGQNEPKQIEVFFLGTGKGFAQLSLSISER